MTKNQDTNTIVTNRRARFDYELLDEFTAGLVLHGHEVKSLRNGGGDLKGAYVTLKDHEAWLTNAHIDQYKFAGGLQNYDPSRARKLLLSKREINALHAARENKLTIVPVRIFKAGQYIKMTIATARGKKTRDKRSTIKKRDLDRDVERDMRGKN